MLEGGLRVAQGSTSLEMLQASPKGLARILIAAAVHHQQSFHFSRLWMPNLPLLNGPPPVSCWGTANGVAETHS